MYIIHLEYTSLIYSRSSGTKTLRVYEIYSRIYYELFIFQTHLSRDKTDGEKIHFFRTPSEHRNQTDWNKHDWPARAEFLNNPCEYDCSVRRIITPWTASVCLRSQWTRVQFLWFAYKFTIQYYIQFKIVFCIFFFTFTYVRFILFWVQTIIIVHGFFFLILFCWLITRQLTNIQTYNHTLLSVMPVAGCNLCCSVCFR